jgi:hypothetical protein
MNERGSWMSSLADTIYSAESRLSGMYAHFVTTNRELDVQQSHIQGRVLVAGGADGHIERAIFCTPKSDFRTPNPEVTSVWATDSSNVLHAHFRYTWPFIAGHSLKIEDALSLNKSVISFPYALQDLLAECPENTFNVITFFGIIDFADQFDDDLSLLIERTLVPGGVFMGSGGTSNFSQEDGTNIANVRKTLSKRNLRTLSAVKLDNWGQSPGRDKIGLLLQK